ncbi:MvdC/MvdD family ATP grasp protein [Actinokineospora guangxiensis]|uniref:MvdC/MvdD family ATP grasp protein n=1 Tax=Actinokineospora guangxiensis TaxID=1490288 RepID=A0ABW0EUI8_9PSEU
MIIVFTSQRDTHSDVVVSRLTAAGADVVRVNTEELPGEADFRLRLGGSGWSGEVALRLGGRRVEPERVRSVWVRRPSKWGPSPRLLPWEAAFATAETRDAVLGLWSSMPCLWMSRPGDIEAASWKVEQLSRAGAAGFAVPKTLVTTDPDELRRFYDECAGAVVVKTFTGGASAQAAAAADPGRDIPHVGLSTTLVTPEVLARADLLRHSPVLVQQQVPKRVDLRVTVVGEEVYTAEIHSQELAATRVDCRRFDLPVRYAAATLPDEVAERCVRFVRGYGLEFGALDMVETPEGDHVFLENNPVGQFLHVEQRAPELRITDAVVSRLMRGAHG